MDKFSYTILGAWIVLAALDFISTFIPIPVVGWVFGGLNFIVICNLVKLFIQDIKTKKLVKKAKEEAEAIQAAEPAEKKPHKKGSKKQKEA